MKKLTITYIMLLSLTTSLYTQNEQPKSVVQRVYDEYAAWRFNECEELRSEFIRALAYDKQQSIKVKAFFPKCIQSNQYHARNIASRAEFDHLAQPIYSNLLSVALLFKSTDSIKCLLQGGVDVNKPDEHLISRQEYLFKITPMHVAAQKNCNETISLLVKHGGDVNQKDYADGSTPLDHACYWKNYDTAARILSLGGQFNTTPQDEREQMMNALQNMAKNNQHN